MRPRLSFPCISLLSLAICILLCCAVRLTAADISGEWEYAGKYLGDISYARVSLKVEGSKLTGNLNELTLAGTVSGDEISFKATRPNGESPGEFRGTAKGGQLEGTAIWSGDRNISWTAK